MPCITLSDAAQAVLRPRLAGEWVEVSDQTGPVYRELVEAAMMTSLHSFARGTEGACRLTEAACGFWDARRNGFTSRAVPAPIV
jgi:hypothetical protein